jgi:Domain of unknown function (DUF4602)
LIQSTKLIEQYTASELTGRDRIKYQEAQLETLGVKLQKRPKTSLKIHEGMVKMAKKRVEAKVTEARNVGIYTKSIEAQFVKGEQALRTTKAKNKKIDKGINGTVGKIKGGIMTVPKSIIAGVENKGGAKKNKSKGGNGGKMGNKRK